MPDQAISEVLLGQGGMGKVFRATQLGLERRVAVEIMDVFLAADAGALGRFMSEATKTAPLCRQAASGPTGMGSIESCEPGVLSTPDVK